MKIEVNNSNDLIKYIQNDDKNNISNLLEKYSEGDELLYNVLKSFVQCGFVTTSSSCGHIYDTWKDPIYIAVYVNSKNVCKILNLIRVFNSLLLKKEQELVCFTFNYNSVKREENIFIEYMFGLQINLFEDCDLKTSILNKIIDALSYDLSSTCIELDYNFIYIVNRFINYSRMANWLNIAFNANKLNCGFDFIFKKGENDKQAIQKTYNFVDGLDEFEYILNV